MFKRIIFIFLSISFSVVMLNAEATLKGQIEVLLFWNYDVGPSAGSKHNGLLIRHDKIKTVVGVKPGFDKGGRTDWLLLRYNHEFFKEIYAMLLLASSTKQEVSLYINEEIHEGFHVVNHVALNN